MKNKIILLILLGMMMITLVSAIDCGSNFLGTFKLGEQINLRQTCDTCTYVNLSSVTIPPNSTMLYFNKAMTKQGIEYNYSFINTSINGDYFYTVRGDKDGIDQSETFCFRVGKTLDISIALFSIFILFILIAFIYFSFKGVFNSEEGGWQIFYICITYLLLFLTFFLLWNFSKIYLYDIPILESIFWIIWLVLSILFFPFVIGISTYILKKQAEALMENDYVQQGYTREEARDMSKKSRRR